MDNIEKGLNSYYGYITQREDIEKDIIEYIAERINANKDSIEKLVDITKEKIDMDLINKILKKESKYKNKKTFDMDEAGFIRGVLVTPKGVLLKQESNIEKVIESYIDAILSRNAVVVSDMEYSEISVKKLILEIIQIALEKFGVDKNLIQLLPYEDVNDEEFNKYQEKENIYHYLENNDYKNDVDEKYLVEGEIDEVIDKINQEGICKCAVIYTKDKDKAYKFINRVNGKNVFVNASIENIQEDIEIDDLYIHKNVIYPTK
jgi:gamma-glutamyl phosphate reductase